MRFSLLASRFSPTRGTLAALALLGLAALPQAALAQTFLVDHGNQSGTTPTFGGTWNTIAGAGSMPTTGVALPLVDSTGASGAVTLTYSGTFGSFSAAQASWSFADGHGGWVAQNATTDLFGSGVGATTSITFGGLVPGQEYKLDHVAARSGSGSNRVSDYTVFGAFADTSPNGDNFNGNTDGFVGGSILTWNSVMANGSGQITLTGTPTSGSNFSYYTATQLTVVNSSAPEPGTLALLALGIVGGVVARRRK
nr:PEP-CTERM sorting domain-containing protein [Armatimonas sp.]